MAQSRRSALIQFAVMTAAVPLLGADHAGPTVQIAKRSEGSQSAVSAARATGGGDSKVVDVTAYGAVGDDRTDSTAAVRAAIEAVRTRNASSGAGGVVYFPAGLYVTKALTVPKNIYLVGESPIASRLRYGGSEVVDAFLTFGEAGKIATYSGVNALWVDGNGLADRDIVLYGPQEGSEISEAIVTGARKVVIDVISKGITGGSNKFTISRCWLWTIGNRGVAGVRVGSGSGPLAIRDTTMAGTNRTVAPPANSGGLVASGSIVLLDNVNVEHFESHSYLDRSSADMRVVTGFSNRYGVKTSKASTETPLTVTNAEFDQADASVLDQGSGITIRYCRSYWNEAYSHDRRHFRRNYWELGSANVYQSDQAQVTMGFTSPATKDVSQFKFSTLRGDGWAQSATIDRQGRFGSADSSFDGAHLRLGDYHLWVDASGDLRMKKGAPIKDDDGAPVGS